MGEYTKKAAAAIALAAAVSIAGAGTALAVPSQTALEESLTTGEITLSVDSPATDATTHDISVSFGGGTYSVADLSGTVPGAGCTQTNPTTVSCGDSKGLQFIGLFGGSGADRLRISSFSSNLEFASYIGRDGDDVITAAPLPTRAGRDGTIASDELRGGRGDDLLTGGAGFDEIDGGKGGNDRLYGGPGGDAMGGGDGKDLVAGQRGNDILRGGRGFDRIFGGRGFDRLARAPAGDRLRGVEKICVHLFPCNR